MAISVESLRSSQPDNKSCDLEYGAINNVQQSNDIINVLVFNVQSRLLKNRPLYLELTKVEFTALLLRALGPTQVSSSFVDSIFDEIDVDKNGSINAEEITKCLYHVKPNKLLDKARFVSSQMVSVAMIRYLCTMPYNCHVFFWKWWFTRLFPLDSLFFSANTVQVKTNMWNTSFLVLKRNIHLKQRSETKLWAFICGKNCSGFCYLACNNCECLLCHKHF